MLSIEGRYIIRGVSFYVSGLFEGDIVMSDHFRAHLTGENAKRDALVEKEYLWEKRNGEVRVPYNIDKNFSKSIVSVQPR
jgi:hypothetical protein